MSNETLSNLFRNITKEQMLSKETEHRSSSLKKRSRTEFEGFQTAKEFLDNIKKPKLDKNQTTINSFFKSEVKTEDNNDDTSETSKDCKAAHLKTLFGDDFDEDDDNKNNKNDDFDNTSDSQGPSLFKESLAKDDAKESVFKECTTTGKMKNEDTVKESVRKESITDEMKSEDNYEESQNSPRCLPDNMYNANTYNEGGFCSFKLKMDSLSHEAKIEKAEISKDYKIHELPEENIEKGTAYTHDSHKNKDDHKKHDHSSKHHSSAKRRHDHSSKEVHDRTKEKHHSSHHTSKNRKHDEDDKKSSPEKIQEKDKESANTNKDDAEKTEKKIENNKEQNKDHRLKPSKETHVPKLKKTEIGLLVVKLLTPAYAERRFDSRDTFKTTARNISHALLYKGNSCFF